jgi:copper chaperone CopZ
VAKVVAKVKEVEGVKEVKAKAAAKEEGTIRTIYPIYQNRLVYKRLERIIVHFAIKGLRNLYLKSLRNLLI